jgi:hypothetical protein
VTTTPTNNNNNNNNNDNNNDNTARTTTTTTTTTNNQHSARTAKGCAEAAHGGRANEWKEGPGGQGGSLSLSRSALR